MQDGNKHMALSFQNKIKPVTSANNLGLSFADKIKNVDTSQIETPTADGFGSGFVQSANKYASQTPAEFIAQDNQQSNAIAPANQDYIENLKNFKKGGGIKDLPNAIYNTGVAPIIQATKIIPNYVSDLVMNVIPGVAGLAVNLTETGWDYTKGIITGDLTNFKQDIHDGIIGEVWRDPSVLAGSATRAVGFGLGKGLSQFWEGDIKGGLDSITQGLSNGVTAFEDAPMSNIIAFKALGGISDAIQSPIETAGKIKQAVTDTTTIVKNPTEWFKKNMPETLKMYTKTGNENLLKQYEEKINKNTELITNVSDMKSEMTSTDMSVVEKETLQTKINNAQDALKTNFEQQNIANQVTLGAIEDGIGINSTKVNPDSIMSRIGEIADNTNNVSTEGYKNTLPEKVPDYQPILDAYKEFSNKIDTLNDAETSNKFSKYFKDLQQRVDLNNEWINAEGNAKTFINNIIKKGVIDYEVADEFAKNPTGSKYRLPTTADLKANSKGVLNSMKEDSNVTNTKNQYNETIGKAIEDTINSEVFKSGGQEGLDAYKKADTNWGTAREISKKIISRSENITDKSAEGKIKVNIDLIEKLNPELADQVRSYFAKKVFEDARTETGYDPKKIIDGVNKNRDILRQSDKDLLTEQADQMLKAKKSLAEISAKEEIIGKNPIEMASKIGKISTLADLENFSKVSGKTPEELGNMYRQNIIETVSRQVSDIKGEEGKIQATEEFIKEEKTLGGKTPESKAVYDKMTSPETKVVIENIKSQLKFYKELSKAKTISKITRMTKIAIGIGFVTLHHLFLGSSLIAEGLKSDKKITEPFPVKIEGEQMVRETPPVKESITKRIIKKVKNANNSSLMTAGGIQANADNNQP